MLRREVAQHFLGFVSRHCSAEDAVPVLIAHNGRAFDVPWIAAEFARSGLQLPSDWHFLDTCQLARRALKQLQAPHGPGFSQASVGTSSQHLSCRLCSMLLTRCMHPAEGAARALRHPRAGRRAQGDG